ncbi:MAG TPA: hypothetical protein VHZ49_14035 [Methylomirabilota bacterium]|jgi:hypothetical protein|nr:hypothetical protein [Methylomirabilota bacterium]
MTRLRRGVAAALGVAVVLLTTTGAAPVETPFALRIDNPTVKLGERALIVATISPADGYRITESYRHRIVNLAATDDGVVVERRVVRGTVQDGRVVFRVDVVPKAAGPHLVVGVFRFSVNNGQQLDIKAAPFEATVTATE